MAANGYSSSSYSPYSHENSRTPVQYQPSSYPQRSPSPSLYHVYSNDGSYNQKSLPDEPMTPHGNYARPRMHDDTPIHSSDAIPLQTQTPKYDNGPPPAFHRQPSDLEPLNPPPRESSRRSRKKFSWANIPWVVYTLTLIQAIVFIAELVKSSQLTGSPIMTKPYFNPMIGPSPYVQINMGARYVACMRNEDGVENNESGPIGWPCPNATDTSGTCSLSQLCGLSGVPDTYEKGGDLNKLPAPNQWYRFITPIFLHGGFIHIIGNLLLQMLLARDMEKAIGSVRFALVYFSSGIWGFVLGGNYAANGLAATGCSGSLFGIIGLVFLDLFYTWSSRRRPEWDLFTLIFVVVVMVVLGLLPTGLDNFSHIGGLLMGLVLGISILHSPNALRKHTETQEHLLRHGDPSQKRRSQPISSDELVFGTTGARFRDFLKEPLGFFSGRKPLWWVWWMFRVGALVAVLVGFIVLIQNFYKTHSSNCHWCQYLSCLPVNGWCERGQLAVSQTSTPGPGPTSPPTGPAALRF